MISNLFNMHTRYVYVCLLEAGREIVWAKPRRILPRLDRIVSGQALEDNAKTHI